MLGIQKHGVTDTAIFHPFMLSLKSPSQIYREAQAQDGKPQGQVGNPVQIAKRAIKDSVKKQTLQVWNTKVQKLIFQCDFIKLPIDEKDIATCKSFINNTQKGGLSFILKACSNGLDTPDNLMRWGTHVTYNTYLTGAQRPS